MRSENVSCLSSQAAATATAAAISIIRIMVVTIGKYSPLKGAPVRERFASSTAAGSIYRSAAAVGICIWCASMPTMLVATTMPK
ncbi:MAG: hypothetical protein V7640_2558 [Betaproteobacteria bacterium]